MLTKNKNSFIFITYDILLRLILSDNHSKLKGWDFIYTSFSAIDIQKRRHKFMRRKRIYGIILLLFVLTIGLISIQSATSPILPCNGYVKESGTSTPIIGATVKLWVYDFITGWQYIGQRTTDSNGYYSFSSVPMGAREVKVSKSGYHTYEGAHQSIIYLDVFTYDYIFFGCIRRADTSQALNNAVVKITCGSTTITDTTDNSGYYSIKFSYSTTGERTFNLVASRADYSTKTNTITRNPGYEYQHYYLGVSWALIVAGETDERFTRDAFGMYNTLIDHYGFTADRIYLITPLTTIDGESVPRDRATSRANVEWGTNQIENNADSDDQVIIWWTGHGSVNSFETDSDYITASQFDDYLDDITCDNMFIFLGPCHSGSFIDDLDDEQNRAIYTSCTSSQSGYVTSDYEHSIYPWATYRGLDPDLDAAVADTNNDDSVSLFELYEFCVDFVDNNIPWYLVQDPQRWVGTSFYSDSFLFTGDRYY